MTFRLSNWQIYAVTLFVSVCVTPFGFPGIFRTLGRHTWSAVLLQAVVTLIGTAGVVLLLRRFPRQSLADLVRESVGTVPGRIYLLLLGLFFAAWGPVGNQMTLIRMVQAAVHPVGSPYLVVLPMLAAAGFAAWFGPEVIARVTESLSFVLLPALGAITVIPYLNGELGRLLPIFPLPVAALADADVLSFALGLRGFVLLLLLGTLSSRPERLGLPAFGGALSAITLVAGLIIAPVAVHGPGAAVRFQFPVLDVMDTVDAASVGIQSFLAVTLVIWYALGWVIAATMLFASAQMLAAATGLASHRHWLPWIGIATAAAAAFPYPEEVRQTLIYSWTALGYLVGLVGPWLLLGASLVRGRGVRS